MSATRTTPADRPVRLSSNFVWALSHFDTADHDIPTLPKAPTRVGHLGWPSWGVAITRGGLLAQSCSARLLLQGRLFRCSWHERQPAASHRSKRASEIVGGGEMARLVQAAAAPGMAPGDGVVARSWL